MMSLWWVILFQLRLPAPITHESSHTSRYSQSSLITNTERHKMTNRDSYARYVLAQFQAFVICVVGKYFSTQPSLFFCCYYTPTFVVSLWCVDLKMYGSFLSICWHHSESVGQRCCLIPTSFCWSATIGYNTDIYQVLGTPVTEQK